MNLQDSTSAHSESAFDFGRASDPRTPVSGIVSRNENDLDRSSGELDADADADADLADAADLGPARREYRLGARSVVVPAIVGVAGAVLAAFLFTRPGLGPQLVAALVLPATLAAFARAAFARATRYVLHDDALVRHVGRRATILRWTDVAEIFTPFAFDDDGENAESDRCTVVLRSGEKVTLDGRVKDSAELVDQIAHRTAMEMLRRFEEDLDAGRRVSFGPLSLDQRAVYVRGRRISWNEVRRFHCENDGGGGLLGVYAHGGWTAWSRVEIADVPNVLVLLSLTETLGKPAMR